MGIPCVVNHNSSLGAHDSQIRSRDQASTHLGIAVCTRVLLLLELQVHPSLLTKKDGGTKACALAEYEKVARIDNKELRYSSYKEPEDKRTKRCLTDASVRSARTIPTTVGSTTDSRYVFRVNLEADEGSLGTTLGRRSQIQLPSRLEKSKRHYNNCTGVLLTLRGNGQVDGRE